MKHAVSFISRIDSLVDQKLSQALDATRDAERRTQLKKLVGKVAIANAKIAHARHRDLYAGEQWKALAARGAKPQRLLWASTSTKNPKYSKAIYVDELTGPETVNTMPVETFREFRAAGRVRPSLTENWAENIEQAYETMRTLAAVGISMQEVTDSLLADGVQKFCEPFDKLLAAVDKEAGGPVRERTGAADVRAGRWGSCGGGGIERVAGGGQGPSALAGRCNSVDRHGRKSVVGLAARRRWATRPQRASAAPH